MQNKIKGGGRGHGKDPKWQGQLSTRAINRIYLSWTLTRLPYKRGHIRRQIHSRVQFGREDNGKCPKPNHQKTSRIPDGIPFRRLASSFSILNLISATKLLQKMSSLPIFFCVFAFLAFQICDAAVGRALVKLGEEYKYENVPGKWIVKRMTPAHKEPQYLFAGQTAWTTNGKDRIGTAELDAATGTMMIPSFTDNDFGSYTFPLEKPNFSAVNGPEGCVLQGVGETMLDLIKKE